MNQKKKMENMNRLVTSTDSPNSIHKIFQQTNTQGKIDSQVNSTKFTKLSKFSNFENC